MRTDSIKIGGEDQPIRGLSVLQSLTVDRQIVQANEKPDAHEAVAKARVLRVAYALRNAGAFLPDPANPNGQFNTRDRSLDDVAQLIAEGDVWANMDEYYEAEQKVLALNRPLLSQADKAVAEGAAGESAATAS